MPRTTRSSNAAGKASNTSSKTPKSNSANGKPPPNAAQTGPGGGISVAAFTIYKQVLDHLEAKKKQARIEEDAGKSNQ